MKLTVHFTLPAALLALTLGAAPVLAQAPVPAPDQAPAPGAQARATMVQGELLRVDAEKRMFWIEGADQKELQFRYTEATEVTGEAQNLEGLATKTRSRVTVEFRAEGGEALATKIAIHAQDQAQPSPQPAPAPQP